MSQHGRAGVNLKQQVAELDDRIIGLQVEFERLEREHGRYHAALKRIADGTLRPRVVARDALHPPPGDGAP